MKPSYCAKRVKILETLYIFCSNVFVIMSTYRSRQIDRYWIKRNKFSPVIIILWLIRTIVTYEHQTRKLCAVIIAELIDEMYFAVKSTVLRIWTSISFYEMTPWGCLDRSETNTIIVCPITTGSSLKVTNNYPSSLSNCRH